ncbi:hypothetical protein LZ30DRAFT_20040 [Colletotrichum cereale]|nr:hypothetical protein LZ30DRAFT_20040 [Colletotrichum cereale]
MPQSLASLITFSLWANPAGAPLVYLQGRRGPSIGILQGHFSILCFLSLPLPNGRQAAKTHRFVYRCRRFP